MTYRTSFPLRATLTRSRLARTCLFGASLFGASLFGACADDASTCVDDEHGACLESVRLTYLNVRYDLTEPVYVNNRVPIELGITATSPRGVDAARREVAVSFSFVEAEPEDPENPIECGSSASVLELVGDGEEHVYYGYVWPTTLCAELAGRTANLRVDFDGGEEAEELVGGLDYPSVVFRESERDAEPNRACRKTADPGAADPGRGCVYAIDLRPTPTGDEGALVDVRYADFSPASSVAVLPTLDPEAEPLPSLAVESTLVVNGRDPYVAAVAPEDVPPELEADIPGITEELLFGASPDDLDVFTTLPGRAVLRFELAPAGDDDGFLPLTVGAESGRVEEVVIDALPPGTSNTFSHELFAEGPTRAALDEGGAWADVSDFVVRACFDAEFPQAGNEGELDEEISDCRTTPVVLVREQPSASAASSFGFDAEITRSVGNSDRIGLSTTLLTQNGLDRTGASSRIEGTVAIEGRLGRSFSIDVARAFGQATLGVEPGSSGYEIGVDAFADRIYSFSDSSDDLVHEEEFSAAKSFRFPGLGFGFGPVRIGFSFELGGEVSFGTTDALELSVDPETCREMIGAEQDVELCGAISRTVTPGFSFTAAIEGGIDVRIARAGVRADLRIVDTAFPLRAALGWGVDSEGDILVLGSANWQLELTLIQGNVSIVGRIGIRRFSRSLRVNLFSFSTPTITRTLLDETMDVLSVLD